MAGRIIEIVEGGRKLHLELGSLVISDSEHRVLQKIDLDEVLGITCYPHGSMFSAALMAELASRGIPLVVSDRSFQPTGILLPVVGNHEQAKRIGAQIEASAPLQKQIWAKVVKQKILMQAMALDTIGGNSNRLKLLASEVKSGDTSNLEGQAARIYWSELLGKQFKRNRDTPGPNFLLNYGYAVLRATLARAISGAGLNPSIAIFHRNAYNGLRLVDDLMEPYRPLVDLRVYALLEAGHTEVTNITKRALVDVMSTDVPHERGFTPIAVAAQYTAISFVKALTKEVSSIEYPIAKTSPLYSDFLQLADWATL